MVFNWLLGYHFSDGCCERMVVTHTSMRGLRESSLRAKDSGSGAWPVILDMRPSIRRVRWVLRQMSMSLTASRMAWFHKVSLRAQTSSTLESMISIILAGGGGRLMDSMHQTQSVR